MTEEWRDIPSLPGYQASSDGRVRRAIVRGNGHPPKIIKPWLTYRGYLQFQTTLDGRKRAFSVHRLVCEAFHGAAPDGRNEARHLNGDKANNRPDNLAWGDAIENALDRRSHGRDRLGSAHSSAKITEATVVEIFRLKAEGLIGSQIGRLVGLNRNTVNKILARKYWKHVAIPPELLPPSALRLFGQEGQAA